MLKTATLTAYPFASPAFAYPTTKLLPIPFESKPFYRFATVAAAPAAVAAQTFIARKSNSINFATAIKKTLSLSRNDVQFSAAPAAAQILTVENKLIGEGKSQYHSQNSLGEATYGHREFLQSHDAVQDAQGNKAGSFSYISPDGRLLTTDYVADQAGYRVASNAFPNQPIAVVAQPIAVAAAAVEKPAEITDSEIVVEV